MRASHTVAAVVLLLAGAAGCGTPIPDEPTAAPTPAAPVVPVDPAQRALDLVNAARASVQLAPLARSAEIEAGALAHARYVVDNDVPVDLSAHNETPGMPEFTGITSDDRELAAGYAGAPFGEVMHFVESPDDAVRDWMGSIFHRRPLISPDAIELGYANADKDGRRTDVMDFGRGPPNESFVNPLVVFPPDGASGVPSSFSGLELPPPPPPPNGFPSGPVISVVSNSEAKVELTRHELFDVDGNPIAHTFIGPDDPSVGEYMWGSAAFYADEPLPSGATVRVVVEGTVGVSPFAKEWSFTVE